PPAGRSAYPAARVLALDADHVVRAALARQRELRGIAREPGHDDRVRPGRACGDDARQAALARPEDQHGVAGPGARQLDRPAEAGAQGIEEDGDARRQVGAHAVHDRERVEVHVVGVGAPEAGRTVERDVAVAEHGTAPAAHRVASPAAGGAVAAGNQRLDRDPIADLDTPALGGAIADGLDDAERLVPGYEREAHRQDAGVLLGIAAADAAGLDPQEPGVVGQLRQRELPQLERARSGLDDGAAGAKRHLPVDNST